MSCDKISVACHRDPQLMVAHTRPFLSLKLVSQPRLEKLPGVQAASVSLLCHPWVPPSTARSTMAPRHILLPDSGEKGLKPKVHTSLLLTSSWPELSYMATPTHKGCWEVEALFWASLCPLTNQGFCPQGENNTGEQPTVTSKIRE